MRDPFEVYTTSSPGPNKKSLDWEEAAPDSQLFVEGTHDAERTAPDLRWLKAILVLAFTVIFVKLISLQVIQGPRLRLLSENNRVRRQTILAPRGLVRDRNGQALALNTASFNLVAVPFDLPKEGLDEQIDKISSLFGVDKAELGDKLKNADRRSIAPIIIKQDMTPEQGILFETQASQFVGFSVQKIPIREYPEALMFSSLLGYTGLVSPGDLDDANRDKYDVADFFGKSGIEAQYENYLHGENGENLVEVDATGKLLNVLGENSPTPGSTLVLNIDKELQQQLYQGLAAGFAGQKAAAVAINPKNGQVLALLSLPGFDNNLFAHGIKKDDYNKLLTDKNLPLFNRAIAGTYPPGSTVKPMVASAVLQEHIVTENTKINDRGVLVIPNQFYPNISYNFYGWDRGGLGPMDVRSAIAKSSDIYFYVVTGGHPSSPVKGLGAEKLAEYYRKFNLGQLTGIDMPGEKPGLVADPDWKASYYKDDPLMGKWYLGDTYHIGIGQGDMLATPLQVALWTSIIANNGLGFKPQVLNRVLDSEGKVIFENKPEVTVKPFVDYENIKIVQEGMRKTVTEGSGRQLSALPISAAGKTGTSQFDGSDPSRTHAWFTAYAPFEDPQIAITVLVEAGGEGHTAAVPVVKQALQWWAENRYKK